MPPEKKGYDFYNDILGAPKYILAPMVEQSELPWRLLSRKYGAELCYTPMFHAGLFVKDLKYRNECIQESPLDRPLIYQFCTNDPELFLQAAKIASKYCEAVDLNLGCPQIIAKRGHYGAFLQDEWELIFTIVNTVYRETNIPVTCKVRVFEDVTKTVQYAQMLEKAGCQLLTVHGRTRDQKGPLTGIASWSHIKAVKDSVNIPVIANGNIQYFDDIEKCIACTGADGVMCAEGNLTNPAIFSNVMLNIWDAAQEYLDFVVQYPCPLSSIRGHLFKLFRCCLNLPENSDLREQLASGSTISQLQDVCSKLKLKYSTHEASSFLKSDLPPWICQPYVRLAPDLYKEKMSKIDEDTKSSCTSKPPVAINLDGKTLLISRKKLKRLKKNPNLKFQKREELEKCKTCIVNPKGLKCDHFRCRSCCKSFCISNNIPCNGHKLLARLICNEANTK